MYNWNAEQYSIFKTERTLPSIDLANAIIKDNVQSVLDIGCGIGNSTAVVKQRFPQAKVIGIDSSEDMLNSARKNNPDIEFIKLDAGKEIENITERFDVVFSNACIQWIPEHKQILKNFMQLLNDDGVLAIQIPQQYKHPMHKIIKSVSGSSKWKNRISSSRIFYNLKEDEYFDILSDISSEFRMWETVYFHKMPSHRSIVEWYKGTAMRPILEQLSNFDKEEFERDILAETEKAYPVQKNGQIIFRFPRLFFTARKI